MAGMNDSFKPATACLSFDPRSTMEEEEEEERWLGATRGREEKSREKKKEKADTHRAHAIIFIYRVSVETTAS